VSLFPPQTPYELCGFRTVEKPATYHLSYSTRSKSDSQLCSKLQKR